MAWNLAELYYCVKYSLLIIDGGSKWANVVCVGQIFLYCRTDGLIRLRAVLRTVKSRFTITLETLHISYLSLCIVYKFILLEAIRHPINCNALLYRIKVKSFYMHFSVGAEFFLSLKEIRAASSTQWYLVILKLQSIGALLSSFERAQNER